VPLHRAAATVSRASGPISRILRVTLFFVIVQNLLVGWSLRAEWRNR
jgi:hypothetical protein